MFAGTQVVCVPAYRPFGLFGHGHRMLPRQQALRCLRGRKSIVSLLTALRSFRARASHASPTTGYMVLAGPQVVCVPVTRPFGLCGHGHHMLSRQQALWCLLGRKSIVSLLTGPSVFLGTGITCFPDNLRIFVS